jgi:nitrogen fixation NifU-like protein
MYMELILDHYRNPRNFGTLEPATMHARDTNPLCGDVIEMQLRLNGQDQVEEVRFMGKGCAISQASASMLTEAIKGKSLADLKALSKQDVLSLLGIQVSAVRLKCALLSLKVLKTGLYQYLGATLPPEDARLV